MPALCSLFLHWSELQNTVGNIPDPPHIGRKVSTLAIVLGQLLPKGKKVTDKEIATACIRSVSGGDFIIFNVPVKNLSSLYIYQTNPDNVF